MNWSDYKETQHYKLDGVGKLQSIYVYTTRIASGMIAQFIQISQQEHDTYNIWKDDDAICSSIKQRQILYYGYHRTNEFRKKA